MLLRSAGALVASLTLVASASSAVGMPLTSSPSRAPAQVVAAAPAVAPTELKVPVRPEADGAPVSLDVSIWRPAAAGKYPVVFVAHGFGGSKDDASQQADALVARGYVVVAWSARGFGGSGGLIHLNDPAYEIADAQKLIDVVAGLDYVELDASGDPRMGVIGGSYGGALALMLAGADQRVDAIVPAITWNDLSTAFFPQAAGAANEPAPSTPAGFTPIAEPGPFKQVWASNFFVSGLGSIAQPGGAAGAPTAPIAPTAPGASAGPAAGANPSCGRFDPTICQQFVAAAQTGTPSAALLEILRSHSPKPTLNKVTAPTLLIQGMADSLFGIEQGDANARGIEATGTPIAVRWSDGGHDAQSSMLDLESEASYAWLDHYVKNKAPRKSASPQPGFTFSTPAARRGDTTPIWTTAAYPGFGGVQVEEQTVEFAKTSGALIRPPGGQPAAMVAIPGLAATGISVPTYLLAALPGQSIAFDTKAMPATTIVGSPRVKLSITSQSPTVTLFVSFWRVAGDQATVPRPLVAPVRVQVTPGVATEVTVNLPAGTYVSRGGSTWRVLVSATEGTYSNDREPMAAQVSVVGPLVLPTVPAATTAGGGSSIGWDREAQIATGLIIALLLFAGGSAYWRRRQRLAQPDRADLADVPLAVDNLVKTYSDGHRAVDDVTWRAEKGQVVGLLGPNGAGKTTTMRMVMGLIAPDSGTVHVLGKPVSAGSQVLNRIGALIEGPGFLPHLTGRENLEAYWRATGRPFEEAKFDEALEVAALGDAVDRPARSYSQGMKQRLGIAQAMLGMPELLILDEPTNGLDPPQIAAMRPILKRYAETGRTVVVSSHLLAEVEMTCSHVVVMHAGRVITSGLVADLVDSADTTLLDLVEGSDGAALVHAMEGLPGIIEVRLDTPTRVVVVSENDRPTVVDQAVRAGARLDGVSSRRHLEDVFLGVISDASGASGRSGAGGDDDGSSGDSLIERLRQVRAR